MYIVELYDDDWNMILDPCKGFKHLKHFSSKQDHQLSLFLNIILHPLAKVKGF